MKKLTVLCDNNTFIDQYLLAEPALSFLIEVNGKKILFDFGYSDVYARNAEQLGIDLNEVDMAVLSHGHNDHTGGLSAWHGKRIVLFCHPECIGKTVFDGLDIGNPLGIQEMTERFDVRFSKEPVWMTEDCCFLGEIPAITDFEQRSAIGKRWDESVWKDDYVMEDSALAIKTKHGLWVVTGCSHAGICNIIEYAKQVTKMDKVAGVIGGFHLLKQDEKLNKTILKLKEFQIERLIPCHCVNLKSKIEMSKILEIEEAGCGLQINLENE